MIGFFSDHLGSQRCPLGLLRHCYPDTGNFIAIVGKLGQGGLVRRLGRRFRSATDLPLQTINAPRWIPGIDLSDHGSYWDHDYRAVMVTDTAFCRNDNYHEPSDTIDTLDFRRMAAVVKGVPAAVTAP